TIGGGSSRRLDLRFPRQDESVDRKSGLGHKQRRHSASGLLPLVRAGTDIQRSGPRSGMLQNLTNAARTALGRLSLRTKFLLSLALTIAGLTFATLLVVRNTVQSQVWQRVEEDARNATLAFQLMQHQRQLTLNHKADLLATLAFMRNGDATAIRDASQDPWQSEDCDLMLLADAKGRVVAMHAISKDLPMGDARAMLRRSLTARAVSRGGSA